MAHNNEPQEPQDATPEQIGALTATTNVDVSKLGLTKGQAIRLIAEVAAGREPTVRKALIMLGGVPLGELPDVDEVGVSQKLGHEVLYLPRTVRVPRHEKLIAEQLPDGSIVIKATNRKSGPTA
jgi:hypothetical protein